jgi:hypothetical protein
MRRTVGVALLAGAAVTGAVAAIWSEARPRVMDWGATWDEVVAPLPGDELIDNPLYVTTRAITIAAPAAAVWPWLLQLGQNRGGFYSYARLENFAGLKIRNADEVRPEWQHLRAGEDFITLDPDGVMKMTIVTLEPERALVLRSGAPGEPPQGPGDFFKGEIEWTWAFVLQTLGPASTRLLVRSRAAWADTVSARAARGVMLGPAHLLMERGMLRGIRARAERAAG